MYELVYAQSIVVDRYLLGFGLEQDAFHTFVPNTPCPSVSLHNPIALTQGLVLLWLCLDFFPSATSLSPITNLSSPKLM